MSSTYDASFLQLVHQSSRTVVADGELALNQTRRTALFTNNEAGSILEHRVKVLHIHVTTLASFSFVGVRLWQFKGHWVALLVSDEVVNALHLWCIHESTLYTNGLTTIQIEQVTTTHQLLGTWTVKDGT